jgi:general secretion pathway protein A
MYLDHYSLTHRPFSISPDPRFLWLGEKYAEALATLKYGILYNKGFLLITGEIGTGKTTLIKSLVKKIDAKVTLAIIPDPRLPQIDFYNILANEFGMDRRFKNKGDFLIHFKKFLIEQHDQNKKVLLIVDEAQRLNHALMDEIRVLSNIEFDDRKLINIFFVGQSEFNKLLLEERNRPLRQRITYNYHLEPLTEQETAAFIAHRLKVAGAARSIFSAEAVREIYCFSQGVPRLINIICDHALVTGYSASLKFIDLAIIKECAKELQISEDISTLSSPKRTVIEHDPFVEKSKIVTSLQQFEPDKRFPVKKAAIITASIILLFGIMLTVFIKPHFEPSDNMVTQNNENFTSNDAAKNARNLSVNRINPQAFEGNTQPDIGISKNEVGKEPPDIRIDEFKTKTELKSTTTEVDLPVDDNLVSRNINYSTFNRPVVDVVDKGPNAPGNRQALAILEHNFLIHFNNDSSKLSSLASESLDKIVELVLHNPDSETLIRGYTDSQGDYNLNKKLSRYRADIVKSYLVTKGIAISRIKAIGLGSQNPIADNMTREGRSKNRRVEINVKIKPNGDLLKYTAPVR